MNIKTLSFSNETLTVQPVCGALVARNAATFAVAMLQLLRPGLRLEINLSSVRHIDGAGVGAMLTCRHAMRRLGCALVLTQVPVPLEQELTACGLQALMVPSVDPSALSHWAH